jgi:ribosomal protein S18 acetylase RimI-like enzyme
MSPVAGIIYRMRSYAVVPEQRAAFDSFFEDHLLPAQLKHGARLVGRWATDDGRVVAVWEYDSRAELERIQAEVARDPDSVRAQAIRATLPPLFTSMQETFMTSTLRAAAAAPEVPRLDDGVLLRAFRPRDEPQVIALWERCELTRPWNDPRKDIARKSTVQRELFVVLERDASIVGSLMAGYDGHRGWLNYLAVDPAHRLRGYARLLVEHAERALMARGCPKVSLQVRLANAAATAFYRKLGYVDDDVVSLGKRLIPDAR